MAIGNEHALILCCGASRASRALALMAFLIVLASPAWPQQKSDDLANQSIEDLMNIEVTSVSKTEQKLSRVASAVFVITQDDIARSGATNIPDLLRMVPGVDVAQIDSNAWAISIRGFNGRFSNELLVLVDGRSVYTPTFGGVFWDVLDLPLEDIERIEVIRGPGATVWGANAVNGVINIITKKAAETQGGSVVAGGGNVDQGFGTLQYGGKAGSSTDFRVFAKYFDQDHFPNSAGEEGGDGWHLLRGGFRSDTTLSPKDTVTVQGDLYTGREGNPSLSLPSVTSPGPVSTENFVNLAGGFAQGIWHRTFSPRSDTTLQISFDRYERSDALDEARATVDLDFQNHLSWGKRQDVVWGLTYWHSDSRSRGNLLASLVPADLATQFFGAFIQDQIALLSNRVNITPGIKFEHNYYTGFNAMPGVRVAWMPDAHRTIWASVSQAVRTPAATDAGIRSAFGSVPGPGGVPTLIELVGNPDVKDEGLIAYEAGYRATITEHVSMSVAAYYNDYSQQETSEPGSPFFEDTPAPPHLVLPLVFKNLMHGETQGLESWANWQVNRRWTLSPGYAFEEIHMHLAPTSQDTTSVGEAEGSSPDDSAQLRSHVVLFHGLAWDGAAYFTGRLTDPRVPSYTRLDTGVSWRCSEAASLSFVGQNLLRDRHEEFVDSTGSAETTLIKRGAYAKFTWQF